MKFEKIDIDKETLENIAVAVHDEFMKANEYTWLEDLKLALSEVIFDVKPSYVEDDWNSCEVVPPSEYHMHDVLIRRKGTDEYLGPSERIGRYRLGMYYSGDSRMFLDWVGYPVFSMNEDSSDFEYKFIK